MVTTSISRQISSARGPASSRYSAPLRYWHLLSLDAPTVAVAWCCAFAYAAHVHLPRLGPVLLAMAAWLLYVTDRLLDGQFTSPLQLLKDRHHFHRQHRTVFVALAIPLAGLLLWLAAYRMDPAPRFEDMLLAGVAGLYLLCVHLPAGFHRCLRFPKELAVAVIFAAACLIPSWSRQSAHQWSAISGSLFAALCWINCIAIETWEAASSGEAPGQRGAGANLHTMTFWIAGRLRWACFVLMFAALSAAIAAAGRDGRTAALLCCIALSALLLFLLDHARRLWTPVALRALADAVLLSPVVLLPLTCWLKP